MLAQFEAIIAKSHIFAINALINSLIRIDFPELAAITVIVVFLASDLFGNLLLLDLILFLLDFSHNLWRFFITAEWAFDNPILFDLMLGPLRKALQMKGVATNSGAWSSGITFYDLGVANCTEIIVFFILLFDYHVSSWHLYLDIFQEIWDFVLVDTTIGDDVPQLFVIISMSKKKRIVVGYIKNLCENIKCV